ncbi:MAG: hypothetical protein KME26_04650 [Oscillatoria princeps RMCB-10]|jgi:hypothetical protein|nr:hypothetical protein [Oscillatoria princeps RMCB-10]
MNQSSETKFLQGVEICKSLTGIKSKPTHLTFQAIELFCQVAEVPADLLLLLQTHAVESQEAFQAVYEYGTSADNWRVDCELGFGIKDHCSILAFFLNPHTQDFKFFTGNFKTPEMICELLKDWKGVDLTFLLDDIAAVILVRTSVT